MDRKKVLGFWDLSLFSFCAIFGIEAIATVAAIGPSAISWWVICIIGYFLPFGLITAELGAAYPEQGGIYVWIKRALGRKWAARSIWYYWIALPLWLPAIYIAIAEIIRHIFFPTVGLWFQVLIGIIMIWLAVAVNLCPLQIAKWVPNFGSITRLLVVIGMGITAVIYIFEKKGFANEINLNIIFPHLNSAIIFIPVILYNLLGCELISGAAGEMKNPARDVPRAVILSALIIASLYLITTLIIWAVVPIDKINVAAGVFQIFTITFKDHTIRDLIITITGFLIASTLFAEIVAWNLGENRTITEAANSGGLPKILGKMNKNGAPVGASVVSGVISTTVIIIYGFIARNAAELFWHVVSFSLIVELFCYLMLFPSFVILRKRDRNIARPYRIPGPDWVAILLAIIAESFVFTAVVILIIQPGHDFIRTAMPIVIGVALTLIVGEFVLKKEKGVKS